MKNGWNGKYYIDVASGVGGIRDKMDKANIDEDMFISNEAIILSMTKEERENPKVISGSRRKRISKGSGVELLKLINY